MKQVIGDLGLRAALLHLQVEGRVHVHGDSLDRFAACLAQQFEEGADGLPAVALADTQYAHRLRIHDQAAYAVPLEQPMDGFKTKPGCARAGR